MVKTSKWWRRLRGVFISQIRELNWKFNNNNNIIINNNNNIIINSDIIINNIIINSENIIIINIIISDINNNIIINNNNIINNDDEDNIRINDNSGTKIWKLYPIANITLATSNQIRILQEYCFLLSYCPCASFRSRLQKGTVIDLNYL
jgi:hypothetical protein